MRKRQIGIVGGFYKDPNKHWSRQDVCNWIPVRAEQGSTLTQTQLRDCPGPRPFVRIERNLGEAGVVEAGVIRGARNVEGKLFVVAGNGLYQISNTGVAIPFGTIPGVGRVSMAHNQRGLGNELLIVNGSSGYVFNTQTQVLGKITDTGYPGAFIADYVDQYLAQVESQGRFWFHSDLADAYSYNTLDQYEAEGDPDRIVSLLVSHREVLVFGRDTIEPFVNTGGQTGTFERASNTVIECGCAAKFSPRKIDNSVMWLDDKRIVRRLDGYTPIRVSTVAIEAALDECSEAEIAQAYAFTWEPRGHKVYYLTVPGRFTFGYDVLTGMWHRRATNGLPHWAVSEVVFWNGKWIACDSRHGRLYELDWDYKWDGRDELVRELTTGKLWDEQNELTLNYVELLFNVGGKESVKADFPEQPLGPAITGDAPDWTPNVSDYSYAYTVTLGDVPLNRVVIHAGSLPPGFQISNTGVVTGNPASEEEGAYHFTVRAIDQNGLFADVADSIKVSQASLWMLRGDNPYATFYSSSDPASWPYTLTRDPTVVTNNNGAWMLGNGDVVVPSSGTSGELAKSIIPVSTVIETESVTLPAGIRRIRAFGNISLAFRAVSDSSATSYFSKVGNGAWTEHTLSGDLSGRKVVDIARMSSGRWVSYASTGVSPDYDAIYSDDPGVPTNWTAASGSHVLGAISGGMPVASTSGVIILLTNGRHLKSLDGASYVTVEPANGHSVGGVRDAWADGDRFIFVGQDVLTGKHICVTDDFGDGFTGYALTGLQAANKIEDIGGKLCVSGAGSKPVYYCNDLTGSEWLETALPFSPSFGEEVYVTTVRRQ